MQKIFGTRRECLCYFFRYDVSCGGVFRLAAVMDHRTVYPWDSGFRRS